MKKIFTPAVLSTALLLVGSLSSQVLQAQTANTQLTIKARGMLLNGVGPKMDVYVNGKRIQRFEVNNTDYKLFTLSDASIQPGSKIDLMFTNDTYEGPGKDINLFVESITHNSTTLMAKNVAVYDKGGSYTQATDGRDTVTGKEGMGENGAMRFVLPQGTTLPPPPPPAGGVVKSTDHRARMVFDADISLASQPSYMAYVASKGGHDSAQYGQINKIPESGYQVDNNPAHKSFERVFSPDFGKNMFRTTIAKSYPTINGGDGYRNTRFTPGGGYSNAAAPGKEIWCALSFVPTVQADYGGIHGLHHVNVGGIGLTPYTLFFMPKGNAGQFGLTTRSTTRVNSDGSWSVAGLNSGSPNTTTATQYFDAAIGQHHKIVLNFRIGFDKKYQPFMKVWHKAGNTWQNSGNPVVNVSGRPIGHNLSDQRHELRPTGVYNWDAGEKSIKSWPGVNNIPAAGERGIRSLSRGGICLEAGAPYAGEPTLSKEAMVGWLER